MPKIDGWVLCEDCHRVLYFKDGPVCPECLAKRAELNPAAPASPLPKGKRGGEKEKAEET